MTAILRLLLLAALLAPQVEGAAPEVGEILRKLVERSEDPSTVSRRNSIAYQRTSRVEYLKDDGTTRRNVVRIYQIAPENGKPFSRLITVSGRPAAEKDEKNRSAARETGEKGRSMALSADLLARYDFTLLREERFNSRANWLLAFVPKPGAPTDGFYDRFINAMAGTLWIDQEDYQLAKADIHLSKRVAFFGGLAGAIEKVNLTLIQRRIENSIWLGEAVTIDFVGRKLFSDLRFRCFENCTDFRAVPETHASAR